MDMDLYKVTKRAIKPLPLGMGECQAMEISCYFVYSYIRTRSVHIGNIS